MPTEKFNPRLEVLLMLVKAAAAIRIPNAAQLTPWPAIRPMVQ